MMIQILFMKISTIVRSEDDECFTLVAYLDLLIKKKKLLAYTHIPNETYIRSFSGRNRRKALGMKPGFPDYFLIAKKKLLFLEMKREKKSTTSPEQLQWIYVLNIPMFCKAAVCKGFNDAKRFIDSELL